MGCHPVETPHEVHGDFSEDPLVRANGNHFWTGRRVILLKWRERRSEEKGLGTEDPVVVYLMKLV